MRVLILIDEGTLPHLRPGGPPTVVYSHDRNLFQFAHECLRKGLTVMISAAQADAHERPYWVVRQVYPTWEQDGAPIGYEDVAPDIVAAVFPEALNIRRQFPHPKIVAIHAAVHWVESPLAFSAQYVYDLITAVRYNIDFVLTQNERMAEILFTVYALLAKWPYRDRIIVAPLGIVSEEVVSVADRAATRQAMGLTDQEIAIVNSGGVWRWTDFNSLLAAFCSWVNERDSRLKLFIMGFSQPLNNQHDAYLAETEQILVRFKHLVGGSVRIVNDWSEASRKVLDYTAASDIGVNVNARSLENWQSYRLRFLDYMKFGLPTINTKGDIMSEELHGDHVFAVDAGSIESYWSVFEQIEAEPALIKEKAAAMRQLASSYNSTETYGKTLDKILAMQRRPENDHETWGSCVLDYAAALNRTASRETVAQLLQEAIQGL
jgi:hypothetical protein